MNFVYIFLYKG